MTIDERIEALTAGLDAQKLRVDALTQSVELLSHMHQDNEARYERLFERQGQLLERQGQLLERLVDIADDHDGRLRRLEGQ